MVTMDARLRSAVAISGRAFLHAEYGALLH